MWPMEYLTAFFLSSVVTAFWAASMAWDRVLSGEMLAAEYEEHKSSLYKSSASASSAKDMEAKAPREEPAPRVSAKTPNGPDLAVDVAMVANLVAGAFLMALAVASALWAAAVAAAV